MLTSKQRAALRSVANKYESIFQIGKDGIGDTLSEGLLAALNKRELIKVTVLETAGYTTADAALEAAELTGAEVVQVIGSKFILYRKSDKNLFGEILG